MLMKRSHLLPFVASLLTVGVWAWPGYVADSKDPGKDEKVVALSPPKFPAELAALDTQFHKLKAERVTAVFDADVGKLNSGYLGVIAQKMAGEKAAGHLDGVLALEEEQQRV